MFANAITKVFGNKNDRIIKLLGKTVVRINQLESLVESLSDEQLAAKTIEFRERVDKGEPLDSLLPETFAVVREAAKRVLGERHYDVQLIGAIVLHNGQIAEMKTGEGKTLTSTAAVYLNALSGKGVHVVTVNDYLAKRDVEWMGGLYRFLGLKTGFIIHEMDDNARRTAYGSDVTYGTNNEFGFDYLRDNMKFAVEDFCQRGFNYAIVDEVDSILVDEARTPLIISGPAEMSTEMYVKVNRIMKHFNPEQHYTRDEKTRQAMFTDEGVVLAEELLEVENLYDPGNINHLHHATQALKAHVLFQRDVDYIVTNGQVVIVDEFTGRTMEGRRFSDGLHQALEAKEGVNIEKENQTLASITFQNYFRMYDRLAGMTGTAETEAPEFKKIYNLDVVVIPTHQDMIRRDFPDVIYKNEKAKYSAIVQEIKDLHTSKQPVLVGTISIDVSEQIAEMLVKEKVPHEVLNAKHHEREAEIIASAGQPGKVTIATNMAGRGTDIKLGEGVCELGGLHILGTSRHESRRIDNQLRGRSGRQGDPGSSRFFLSLEDDLLRIFGSKRISGIMDKLGMEDDEPIEHSMISKAIENAQRKVEGHHFDTRKHLLEYDDVMNMQREVIYGQRREVLQGDDDMKPIIEDMIGEFVDDVVDEVVQDKIPSEDWEWQPFNERVAEGFNIDLTWNKTERTDLNRKELLEKLEKIVKDRYSRQEEVNGAEQMRYLERMITLQMVDTIWKEHLLNMDHLKEGIGLRGYGQKNPLDEYKREGFNLFTTMTETMKQRTVSALFRVQVMQKEEIERLEEEHRQERERELAMSSRTSGGTTTAPERQPLRRNEDKVGRNAPCPCDSGKKYKKCCGKLN